MKASTSLVLCQAIGSTLFKLIGTETPVVTSLSPKLQSNRRSCCEFVRIADSKFHFICKRYIRPPWLCNLPYQNIGSTSSDLYSTESLQTGSEALLRGTISTRAHLHCCFANDRDCFREISSFVSMFGIVQCESEPRY